MKISVTGVLAATQKTPVVLRGTYRSIISEAAKIGYDGVELHMNNSSALDRKALSQILKESNMTLTSIGTGPAYSEGHLSLSSENSDIRGKTVKRINEHIITAKEYNSVVIIGLIKGKICECTSKTSYLKNLGKSLDRCLQEAEKNKIVLALEMVNRYESDFLNTIGEGLAYIKSIGSDYLKLHIDTFHMNIEEPDMPKSILKAKGKICLCHIADSDRWYAGHGHINFTEIFQALYDIGYDGTLSVEALPYPNPLVSAENSYATVTDLLKKTQYAKYS